MARLHTSTRFALACITFSASLAAAQGPAQNPLALPEAPSAMLLSASSSAASSMANLFDPHPEIDLLQTISPAVHNGDDKNKLPPCDNKRTYSQDSQIVPAKNPDPVVPCRHVSRFEFVIDYGQGGGPMTPKEKGFLAVHDVIDPFNLATIVLYSGFAVGINSHSPYGPGFKGFGRLIGYSLLEDSTGEFFGTFAIPALTHEDPRYRRMPDRSVARRVGHAFAHTYVTEGDDGHLMPNYGTLGMYPITAELGNLYIPGGQTDGVSTIRRILVGYATDPISNLVNEFLPDIAKRIHIHVVFVQEILNEVASGSNGLNAR